MDTFLSVKKHQNIPPSQNPEFSPARMFYTFLYYVVSREMYEITQLYRRTWKLVLHETLLFTQLCKVDRKNGEFIHLFIRSFWWYYVKWVSLFSFHEILDFLVVTLRGKTVIFAAKLQLFVNWIRLHSTKLTQC